MRGNLEAAVTLLGGTSMPDTSDNNQFIVFGDPSKWESLKLQTYRVYGAPIDMRRISYYPRKVFWKDGKFVTENVKFVTENVNYYEGVNLYINVNVTRPAQTLANDINKRLLIPAIEANHKNVANTQANMDYIAKVLAFGREFGGMQDAAEKVRVYISKDYKETAELLYITDTYAVLRLDLPHDKMRKVINFIKNEVV